MNDRMDQGQRNHFQVQDRNQKLLDRPEAGIQPLFTMAGKVLSPTVLFMIILALGIYARVWQFGSVPPGLNKDEASIGVEAYDLLHFGMDRNGVSFPVNFISWGSGQNALYGYLLIPFIAMGGLTPLMVRLPMLITGILTLPVVFFVAKRMLGMGYGLAAMFLVSISPWHIILSRWGLESNLLPFTFLLGFACLIKSRADNYWFVPANVFFALSLYAYGTAYAAVPIFILCAIPILLYSKRISIKSLVLGLAVLFIVGSPIGLLVLVNTVHLNSIHLEIFTIPRYPVEARFLGMSATSNSSPLRTMLQNTSNMVRMLLISQSDSLIWNVVEPYGYLYAFSIPLAILGALLLVPRRRIELIPEKLLILGWLIASLCIGVILNVNINRINLIFIPIILCVAIFLVWLGKQKKLLLIGMIAIFLLGFYSFNNEYHRGLYQRQASAYFYPGLLPALDFVREKGDQPICVTNSIDMPYIFVLFSEKMNPSLYLKNIKYDYPGTDYRNVTALGRYTFGLDHCPNLPNTIYVTKGDDQPPQNRTQYTETDFLDFHVYSSK